MDFLEYTHPQLEKLNSNERKIFDYVIKNIHDVKNMSIRVLSSECFVSTTTMFRFVRKLGFDGYGDFVSMLRITDNPSEISSIPNIIWKRDYTESYIKNFDETLRVLPEKKIVQFFTYLSCSQHIYLLAEGLSSRIAEYIEHLYSVLGFSISYPKEHYQIQSAIKKMSDSDMLFAISFSGESKQLLNTIERIYVKKSPILVSITCSNNNSIQNMSDVNFYTFADIIVFDGVDITSRTSMAAIAEVLAYGWLAWKKSSEPNN